MSKNRRRPPGGASLRPSSHSPTTLHQGFPSFYNRYNFFVADNTEPGDSPRGVRSLDERGRDLMTGSLDRLAVTEEATAMTSSSLSTGSPAFKGGSSVMSSMSSDSAAASCSSSSDIPTSPRPLQLPSKRTSFFGSRLSSFDQYRENRDFEPSYHYVSESHQRNLATRIQGLLERHQLCDVVLISGQRRISAHRLILSGASDYFAAMFTSGMAESDRTEIEIQQVDPSALETLVNFCYTGEILIEESSVEALLSAACLLQLGAVIEACSEFLKTQLDPSNCLGIRSFADMQGCHRLHTSAQNYITDNFTLIMGHGEFLELGVDDLEALLTSDDLNVTSEHIIFHALCSWLQSDMDSRKPYASRLLACIRLPFLSPEFLSDQVEHHPVFKEDRACQELIMEAMKYHLLPNRRSYMQLGLRTKPRKATVGQILAFGGMDSSKGPMTIEAYSLLKDSWRRIGHMSGRRQQFGLAVMEGKVFVVGGRDGLKTLNTFECWDPESGKWYQMPPMTTGRHGLGVATLSGPLYAVGGHDGWSYLSSAERWDPQTKTWSSITEMSTPRSTAGVAVLGGRLYVAGGRDSSQVLRSVEYYNPHTNKWTQVRSMNRKRSSLGLGVLNALLYAVGGMESQSPAGNPSSIRFATVERYDPDKNEWTMIASLSTGRDGVGVGCFGDSLYAVGGFDGHKFLSIVEAYDPETNKWNPVSSLLSGRTGTGIAVLSNGMAGEKRSVKLGGSQPSLTVSGTRPPNLSLLTSSSIETL